MHKNIIKKKNENAHINILIKSKLGKMYNAKKVKLHFLS